MDRTYYDSFVKKLREMFMMDHAELDFGIYRIMNYKRKEIDDFLTNKLLPQVETILKQNISVDGAEVKRELEKKIAELREEGFNDDAIENSKPVKELRAKLTSAESVEDMQSKVFSCLTQFFSRYYKDGDFISQRRYKSGGDSAYMIPYNGEEVKLCWANQDQYYIKTSEYFKNYVFILPKSRKKVHFVLKDASTEQNNNKNTNGMERRFALWKDDENGTAPLAMVDGELEIYFTYELMPKATKQKDLLNKAYNTLLSLLQQPEYKDWQELLMNAVKADKSTMDISWLQKHLNDYTAKNSFDYFIHKDLGGFLRRELDFFIKNEVLVVDDLTSAKLPAQLAVIKAIEEVGNKIITFLAQLEDFQKKLWLKKKFVVGCDYCITLDRVPESMYPEIATNEAQQKEWVRLFAIDEIKGDLTTEAYSDPLTVEFLKQNPFLVLDTMFFSVEFKHKLLGSMDDIDGQTNGLLIKSDNFQALRILLNKYYREISGIYADPPYNTDNDGFLYKDGYKHSSWLTMINDRLHIANSLCKDSAPQFYSLNSNEFANFVSSLKKYDTWFSIKVRHEERILRKDIKYQDVIEYLIQTNPEFCPTRIYSKEDNSLSDYTYNVTIDDIPDDNIEIGGYKIEIYHQGHYQITQGTPSEKNLKRYLIRGSLITQSGSASEFYEANLRARRQIDGYGSLYKVIGMGMRGDGLGYRYIMQPLENGGDNGIYFQGFPLKHEDKGLPHPNLYDFQADFNNCSNEGGVKFPGGKKPQVFMDKIFEIAGFEKDAIILDFFAGSAPTSHEVIRSNVRERADRKYILVEMGDHFEKKTKERTMKSIYAYDKNSWSDGKPVTREGVSQCFKYIRLEQYEDTLNNLKVKDSMSTSEDDGSFNESYMLGYMLDTDTKGSLLNLQWFRRPFDVKIRTTKDNELVETPLDMVETFNYLIGLNVETESWHQNGNICVVEGITHIGNEKTLVIWRNCDQVDNEALNAFFSKQDFNTLDMEFDTIYVNGDNTLPNMKRDDEHWKVVMIEQEFKARMFEEE